MRGLLVVRLALLVVMLAAAVLWLLRIVDDVSGPLLVLCPLAIQTYRWELRRAQR